MSNLKKIRFKNKNIFKFLLWTKIAKPYLTRKIRYLIDTKKINNHKDLILKLVLIIIYQIKYKIKLLYLQ